MSYTNPRISASRVGLLAMLQVLVMALVIQAPSCTRSPTAQRTFASPEDAGAALVGAARSGDQNTLIAIFGPDSKKILVTDDAEADRARLREFVDTYDQMHRWRPITAGGQVLQVGPDNYPFPIPLGQNSSGRWYFDTGAGKDEILARRIGKNELTAMDASKAIADAEQQYWQESRDGANGKEFAQKFISDPGTHDGLYWAAVDGQQPSPLGQMGDFTKTLSSSTGLRKSPLFNGYYYRILTSGDTPNGVKDFLVNGKMTGGFTILAYPAEYRNSGIMSFLIGQDGRLYQKDLGEKTAEVAANMTQANPADGWTSIQTQTNTASRMQ
jgi:hypothetical protein